MSVTIGHVARLCAQGCLEEAVQTLYLMLRNGFPLSANFFYCIVLGCIEKKDHKIARKTYCLIVHGSLDTDTFLGSHLIRMFASCGSLDEANQVFQRLSRGTVFTWSAIISAHAILGQAISALELFCQMQTTTVKPDSYLFVSVLKACTNISSIVSGMMIHSHIVACGYEQVVHIGSTLVDMYVKCGSLEDALKMFSDSSGKDLVTWNVLISGYTQHLLPQYALIFWGKMFQINLEPDEVTLVNVIRACASMKALDQGRFIHVFSVESGYESVLSVANSVIDLYIKCDRFDCAFNVFTRLPKRDEITWSTIMTECAQSDINFMLSELFRQMRSGGVVPDAAIFVCTLKACSNTMAFPQGREIHALYIESGLDLDAEYSAVGNSLIGMYFKHGNFEDAYSVFIGLQNRDIVTWNAMIGGFAQYKDYDMALTCFKSMKRVGYIPDDVTIVSLICACNNVGWVELACHEFSLMHHEYGISPTEEHYNCMADLLGNAGCLEEARDFMLSIPVQLDAIGWVSFLNHCRVYGDTTLAAWCFQHLISIHGRNASSFLLMSYTYDTQWDDACKLDELRKSSNSWKKPGLASLAIGNQIYEFSVGCKEHSHVHIHSKLNRLSVLMDGEGYLPSLDLVLLQDEKQWVATEVEKIGSMV